MWLASLVLAAILAAVEARHYRTALELAVSNTYDAAVLYWVLAAKTLVLFGGPLVIGAVLSGLGFRRGALLLFGVAAFMITLWLLADVRAQQEAGAHVLELLKMAGGPDANRVAGGGVVARSLVAVGVSAGLAAGLVVGARLLTRVAVRRAPWLTGRWYLPTIALVYGASIGGVVSAQLWFSDTRALQRLYAGLPFEAHRLATGSLVGDVESFSLPLNRALAPMLRRMGDPIRPYPVDVGAKITNPAPPNLFIVCCDSFRYDFLTAEHMPRVYALAGRGLWLRRHYAQTNASQWGIFTLLYGRSAVGYDTALDAGILPQLNVTLATGGYRRTYLSPMYYQGWLRMEQYVNPKTFEEEQVVLGAIETSDRLILNRMKKMAAETGGAPKFVLAFLSSTHHPFYYPKEYEKNVPASTVADLMWNRDRYANRTELFNRYRNTTRFMDDAVADFIESLDLSRNVVVVTGDHGESIWDDGSLAHKTRASEIQTRVPCFVIGGGVPARAVDHTTGHTDLVPTLVHALNGAPTPIAHAQGRDLFLPEKELGPDQIMQGTDNGAPGYFTGTIFAPEGRMRVRVYRDRPQVEVLGMVDLKGNIDPYNLPPPAMAGVWANRIRTELRKLRR